jgi:hypothetical protein
LNSSIFRSGRSLATTSDYQRATAFFLHRHRAQPTGRKTFDVLVKRMLPRAPAPDATGAAAFYTNYLQTATAAERGVTVG